MTAIKLIVFYASFFLLGACNEIKTNGANNLAIKYEIVHIKPCTLITSINGFGHIYSEGITKKIDTTEKYFLKNDDMIYLDKESLLIIESSDKYKILLNSNNKKSSFLLKLDKKYDESCDK